MDDQLRRAEALISSLLSPEIPKRINILETTLVNWGNPDLKGIHTPVEQWPMARLSSALTIAVIYLCFVFAGSLIFMAAYGRKESSPETGTVLQKFTKEPLLILQAVYNLIQVLLCAYMASAAFMEARREDYGLICNKFDIAKSGMASVLWVFYMSKILDFWDTVFIIFRRKWRQLSFLHVYHHSSIFLIYWLNLRAGYDGDIYYTIVANSSIHFIMYGYYLLRTFNVPVPIFIKALVTNMQMIQFVTMISQALYLLYFGCPYPPNLVKMYFVYILSMLALFSNFANKTYKKNPKVKSN